jgi:nitroimidazol reductase NimA-like FMN-containing flavoprotein (pyridoxamine 5'-phosphate oxidase superfamily)
VNGVRYKLRECNDQDKINSFLNKARFGYLGLADGKLPYVVPLNYVWWNGKLYFHGDGNGRRNKVMSVNPEICFTVCEEYGTITDPVPAKTDTAYMSVMVFGKAQPVIELDEEVGMLQAMLDKYIPDYYDRALSKQHVDKYRSSVYGTRVQVYRVVPDYMTAKENPIDEEKMYVSGN